MPQYVLWAESEIVYFWAMKKVKQLKVIAAQAIAADRCRSL
jgi:hypothetical protein